MTKGLSVVCFKSVYSEIERRTFERSVQRNFERETYSYFVKIDGAFTLMFTFCQAVEGGELRLNFCRNGS